jgi:hypothetical protein
MDCGRPPPISFFRAASWTTKTDDGTEPAPIVSKATGHFMTRVACSACGAAILTSTAERTGGLCMPCTNGTRKAIEARKTQLEGRVAGPRPFELIEQLVGPVARHPTRRSSRNLSACTLSRMRATTAGKISRTGGRWPIYTLPYAT